MRSLKKKSIYALLGLAAFTFSCTEGFEELSNNPNAFTPENVTPSFLLADVISRSVLDPGMHQRMTHLTNDVWAQYHANEGFSTQQGLTNDEWVSSFYTSYHSPFIANLNEGIRLGWQSAAAGQPLNETQIAKIWKVWVYSRATDLWGDIPYFQAADGSGANPPYDPQELIYKDMLAQLKGAVDSLSSDNPAQIPGQDYVYNDDIEKWKKFANSLRLRLALRISNVEPGLAQQVAEEAIADGVMTSSDDATTVTRTANFGWGYAYPYTFYFGWGSEHMSRSMENLLTGLGGQAFPNPPAGAPIDDMGFDLPDNENSLDPRANKFRLGVPSTVDPRGPIYFSPSVGSAAVDVVDKDGNTQTVNTQGRWVGVPAGLGTSEAGLPEHLDANVSKLGPAFSQNPERPYEVMTYHEVCFLLAEAAYKGWNVGSGTTQQWYEEGITASMLWHGIDATTIANYISSTDENIYGTTVSYTHDSGKTHLGSPVDNTLSKLITQKYIAMFPDGGWEAWADHRRLHLPVLVPFANMDSRYTSQDGGPDNFPKRITYPSVEEINNKELYDAAVQAQGPDSETTNLWWDQD
ncbi:MAG: SusD/RagB family nutrient-binding outer membrane lipoprotein [Cyclobacteriaceae bacterium]